jgi:hypothetical protein
MAVYRFTPRWDGFSGAPGYTNFHFLLADTPTGTELADSAAKIRTWFDALKAYLPNICTITFPAEIVQLNTETGELEGTYAITAPASVTGTGGTTAFSSATGVCVNWNTAAVVNGRRLRGRTFFVPCMPTATFQSDGTLGVGAQVAFQAASTTLADSTAGMPFVVYHRPTLGGSDGVAGPITSSSVNDKTAVLRSRRD